MAVLKRIKEIKNVGVFSSFSSGSSIGFEKLTFIYGLNTYGKTTLTDIFQSLKTGDSTIIESRKTIPATVAEQSVKLSIQEEATNRENDLLFKNGNWNRNSISQYIEIFGDDFIHKNVFTGLTIERANKENFTQFILGDSGVTIAKKIQSKRQQLGLQKKELKTLIPSYVYDKSEEEIKKFLEFSTANLDLGNLEAQLYEYKNSLKSEQARLEEPTKILNLNEPSLLPIQNLDVIGELNALNTLFTIDYSKVKEDSFNKLETHLKSNFLKNDGAENWIKSGLHYCKDQKDGNCPFCGQLLNNAKGLIELYNSYFDEAYSAYISKITHDLNGHVRNIENFIFNKKSFLQTSLIQADKYKGLIPDSNFNSNLDALNITINRIQEDDLNSKKNEFLAIFKTQVTEKIKTPYKKIEIINLESLVEDLTEYNEHIMNSIKLVSLLIDGIKAFKKQYENISLTKEVMEKLNKSIAELDYKIARIKLDTACTNYKTSQKMIIEAELEITSLENQLEIDQSKYLGKVFELINQNYKTLGSKNFTLEKETDKRGHFPVYSLKIKFHGITIPNEKLGTIFSASDRRALALSIFWSNLCMKSDEDKLKTIIILDDPVTSFDDNRITNSINLFKDAIERFSQLIVLTHYPNFIKRFCEITKPNKFPMKFIELNLCETSSYLSSTDIDHFNRSDYEKIFIKIYGYINRTHRESIKTDLRPFLENLYLPLIFAKKIRDNNIDCSSLEKMIDGIFDDQFMKNKFHSFRNTLNPDSHIFTSNNEEDFRNFASDMMDYLYSLTYATHT